MTEITRLLAGPISFAIFLLLIVLLLSTGAIFQQVVLPIAKLLYAIVNLI